MLNNTRLGWTGRVCVCVDLKDYMDRQQDGDQIPNDQEDDQGKYILGQSVREDLRLLDVVDDEGTVDDKVRCRCSTGINGF